MAEAITDRAKLLLERTTPTRLSEQGGTSYTRWVNIKSGRARVGADEIEILGRAFPQYRWWLMTGEEQPEMGQISPATEETRDTLKRTGTDSK